MKSVYDSFNHYEKPLNDFERARQQISTPFDYLDVDLSIARDNEILQCAGDFLYIDLVSSGEATLELNNQHEAQKAPFHVIKGFALNATFKQLKFSNVAQAGAMMRIMFSTGDRVTPATSQTQISGNVTTLEDGLVYGASFKSNAALAANTPEVVFTAGSNPNGAVVYDARFITTKAGGICALLAKATAPTSVTDGDCILSPDYYQNAANVQDAGKLIKPIKIPAGKGLYFIDSGAQTLAMRSVLYKLL